MKLLYAASLRHLWRHPAQLALALLGLTLGVGTIVAVDVATASSRRAFELSLAAVDGAATHQLTGGPHGIPEALYVRLRTQTLVRGGAQPAFAPLVNGYALVGDRLLQLIGVDPFAAAELEGDGGRGAAGSISSLPAARRWFTEPGALLMSATSA